MGELQPIKEKFVEPTLIPFERARKWCQRYCTFLFGPTSAMEKDVRLWVLKGGNIIGTKISTHTPVDLKNCWKEICFLIMAHQLLLQIYLIHHSSFGCSITTTFQSMINAKFNHQRSDPAIRTLLPQDDFNATPQPICVFQIGLPMLWIEINLE